MRKWLLVPIVLATVVLTLLAQDYVLENVEADDAPVQKSIRSAALGETRPYSVRLPDSYGLDPNRRYPVVYVLDGPSQEHHTAASAALMARVEVTPEVIVVGIPNLDDESRQRDLTPPAMRQVADEADSDGGRGDRFLQFIGTELIPEIERSYRTSSSRALAGHSRSGLFVVYALTARPKLFQAYLANSPAMWRDGGEMVRRLGRFLDKNRSTTATLYLSLGSDENPKMKAAFERTVATLDKRAPASLRWHAQLTPGAGHNDNAEMATPGALRLAFDPGWRPQPKGARTLAVRTSAR